MYQTPIQPNISQSCITYLWWICTLTDQFSDATNARDGGISSVIGLIPAYKIMDLSFSYDFKKIKLETSINNLANEMYFTRRATGYPGPGILPSDGRSFYFTVQFKM